MNLVPKGGHQPASSPTSLEMRQIARKWELFVSGAEVDLTDLSPVIREAWIRSKKAGVDPALPHAPLQEIPSDPEILRQEIDWLPRADRIFSLLCNFFTESHQAVYLVDHQGRLLAIRGGRKAMANAEKIYAIPGGEWSEEKVGCGAIGNLREREVAKRLAILDHFGELAGRYPADGLLALDRSGRILTINPAIEQMLSLPRFFWTTSTICQPKCK
jgi:sigma-54 dependent transcriptional regulator, acetoin dehydrogenase operon transcriptional activator AcoR